MGFKAGFIGLLGMPNAGKSTLVNALIGEKVGIISDKPQTTRQRVQGVLSTKSSQIIFIDAPGYIKAETGLNHFLQKELEDVIASADALAVILNLDEKKFETLMDIIEMAKASGKPWRAIINKSDLNLVVRENILKTNLRERGIETIEISALKSKGKLKETLLPIFEEMLPESPGPLVDTEIYTTQSVKELCAEIVREKCFEYVHQEIPYGMAVQILKYIEDEGETVKIYADLIVSKENHKAIVVGQGGQGLKRVGQSARMEIEKILGRKVFLGLHVKVKAQWMKNERKLKEMGYGLPV